MQGVGGDDRRLAHAVTLQDAHAGARLELGEGALQQRGGATDEQPHVGRCLPGETGVCDQARVEGRHAHQHRGLGQQADHLVVVEPRQPDHRPAVQQDAVQGDEQPVHVEDGQGMQQHVPRPEPPGLVQRQGVGRQIAVAEHGALGPAGGAAGVDDGRQVAGGGLVHALQRRQPGRLPRQGDRVRDEQLRLGVVQEVADLSLGVGGVEGQEDAADLQGRQVEHQGFRGLGRLRRHPVPHLHAPGLQQRRQPRDPQFQVAVADHHAVGEQQGGRRAVVGKARSQEGVEIGVHGSVRWKSDALARKPGPFNGPPN